MILAIAYFHTNILYIFYGNFLILVEGVQTLGHRIFQFEYNYNVPFPSDKEFSKKNTDTLYEKGPMPDAPLRIVNSEYLLVFSHERNVNWVADWITTSTYIIIQLECQERSLIKIRCCFEHLFQRLWRKSAVFILWRK